jgi:hypothetical protein
VPNRSSAAEQQAVLLTIDTACQALRIAAGPIDCRAGAGSLPGRFHITRLFA